jgi:hypothetical protein
MVFLSRRRTVFCMTVVSLVALGAHAAAAAGPAPFPMPLDSGTKYVAQAADARAVGALIRVSEMLLAGGTWPPGPPSLTEAADSCSRGW